MIFIEGVHQEVKCRQGHGWDVLRQEGEAATHVWGQQGVKGQDETKAREQGQEEVQQPEEGERGDGSKVKERIAKQDNGMLGVWKNPRPLCQ